MPSLGPLPDVPNVLKIRYIWDLGGQPGINVYHVKFTGTIADQTAMAAILSQLATLTTTNVKPLVTGQALLTGIEGTDLGTRTGVVATVAGFGAGGALGASPMPNNVALCVSLPVAYRYRGGHPRMYLPSQTTVNLQNQRTWTTGWTTTVANGMNGWRTAINAMTGPNAPFKLCLVSYFTHDANKNPIYRPLPIPTYDVAGIQVHSRVDTQRRRLGREA